MTLDLEVRIRRMESYLLNLQTSNSICHNNRLHALHAWVSGERNSILVLPPVLKKFLTCIEVQNDHVEMAMIWGSYIRGVETQHGYSILPVGNTTSQLIMEGPSDLDALVITKYAIDIPNEWIKYHVINENGLEVNVVERDIFRDVLVAPLETFSEWLSNKSPSHLSCLLNAYFNHGLVLKFSEYVDSYMNSFCRSIDYTAISKASMARRNSALTQVANIWRSNLENKK